MDPPRHSTFDIRQSRPVAYRPFIEQLIDMNTTDRIMLLPAYLHRLAAMSLHFFQSSCSTAGARPVWSLSLDSSVQNEPCLPQVSISQYISVPCSQRVMRLTDSVSRPWSTLPACHYPPSLLAMPLAFYSELDSIDGASLSTSSACQV